MRIRLNPALPVCRGALLTLAASITILLPSQSASAATLTWDPLVNGFGSDGSGPWDNTAVNWATGGGDIAFPTSAQTTITAALSAGANTISVADTAGLAVGQVLSTDRFPDGTTITAIDTVNRIVTLSNLSIGTQLAANSAIHFSFQNDAAIGTDSNEAGTITISGNQAVDSLDLYEGASGTYTLTGGTITVSPRNVTISPPGAGALKVRGNVAISSQLSWKNLQFQSDGKTLTLSGGSITGAVNGSFNGSVSGFDAFIALTSTLAVTGGTYTTAGSGNTFNIGDQALETGGLRFSGGIINSGGSFQVANDRTAYAEITGTAVLNANGQISIGRNQNANIGKLVVDGGTVNSPRTGGNDTEVQVGRANGVGILNVESGILTVFHSGLAGGVLVINSDGNNAGASGTVNLSGGTTTVEEIRFNGGNNHDVNSTNGSGTLNMTGGTLYMGGSVKLTNAVPTNGPGGIVNRNPALPANITLSGGTVGANANWASSLNMTLGTTNGNVTFKAANAADAPFDIALSGVLSGTGGFTKTGAGVLTLTGANTQSGNIVVNAGTLALGTINSNNESATVTIADTGATLQLNYAGTDSVSALVIGANPPLAAGVYGAVGSPSPIIGISQITGTGTLTVGAAPSGSYSTWAAANGINGEPASGDFDHDGLTNLIEYALGLNPTAPSASPGTLVGGVITFTKGADAIANNDVTFEIEESSDLGLVDLWTTVVTEGPSDNSPDISYMLPSGQPKEFARLKITQVTP